MTHPARCPGCGSPAYAVLASDVTVPIYRCGSWGGARRCERTTFAPEHNVRELEPEDALELAELAALLSVAWSPSR